ncbi:MAG: MaoC/PaaZ C-terminal domain-containing protein [Desulfobacteraceae bacterium]
MINPMRQRAIDGLKVGDVITFSRRFTQEETHQFGELTRDYNPVHYDVRWANAKGLDDLICHGLLVGSMICEIGGQIGWLASGMNFKFIRPVMIGETITCKATLVKIEPNGRARDFTTRIDPIVDLIQAVHRVVLNPCNRPWMQAWRLRPR